jgi:uncharacterized membrane protein
MSKKRWILSALLALPLAAAGLTYGQALVRADHAQKNPAYVCPLTGEELPCPNCCPLNGKQAAVHDALAADPATGARVTCVR